MSSFVLASTLAMSDSNTQRSATPRAASSLQRMEAGPEQLVVQTLQGDAGAWRALQAWAFPLLERWARSHPGMRRRRLHLLVDDVREATTAALERLRADEFANLHKYLALRACDPHATIESWLYGALDFTVREHLRMRFGRVRARTAQGAEREVSGPHKRELNTLAPRINDDFLVPREGLTAQLTWRQIMTYARGRFSQTEAQALEHYVEQDASYEELAVLLDLDSAAAAERMIRRLKERLRAHFRST